jgi:hypothetical protein
MIDDDPSDSPTLRADKALVRVLVTQNTTVHIYPPEIPIDQWLGSLAGIQAAADGCRT